MQVVLVYISGYTVIILNVQSDHSQIPRLSGVLCVCVCA